MLIYHTSKHMCVFNANDEHDREACPKPFALNEMILDIHQVSIQL